MAVPFAGAAALIYGMAADEVPVAVPIAVGAVFAAMFVVLVLSIHATATISDERHLTIRRVFRRHVTSWPDVQAIEIEANPNRGSEEAPRRIAVLYDAVGGRYTLPHLNERSRPDFVRDVEALREVWMLRRGDDWVPVPAAAAAARMAEARRQRPVHPVLSAALVALFAFWVGWLIDAVGVMVLGVFDFGDYGGVMVLLHPVVWMPVLAFVITLVIEGVRRRG